MLCNSKKYICDTFCGRNKSKTLLLASNYEREGQVILVPSWLMGVHH